MLSNGNDPNDFYFSSDTYGVAYLDPQYFAACRTEKDGLRVIHASPAVGSVPYPYGCTSVRIFPECVEDRNAPGDAQQVRCYKRRADIPPPPYPTEPNTISTTQSLPRATKN